MTTRILSRVFGISIYRAGGALVLVAWALSVVYHLGVHDGKVARDETWKAVIKEAAAEIVSTVCP